MPSLFLLYRDSLSQSGSGGYTDQPEQPLGDNHSQINNIKKWGKITKKLLTLILIDAII